MVVVMSQRTYKDLESYELNIVGTKSNKSHKARATIKKETAEGMSCEYVMVLVQAQTLSNPDKLEIESGGRSVEVGSLLIIFINHHFRFPSEDRALGLIPLSLCASLLNLLLKSGKCSS